jgi:hypothetical protein
MSLSEKRYEDFIGLPLAAFLERLFEWHPEPGVPEVAAPIADHLSQVTNGARFINATQVTPGK